MSTARRVPRTGRRGLTFLEVEIALLLLMLGVLAVIELAPLSMKGARLAEQQAMAGQFAQFILETELNQTYGGLLALNPPQMVSGDIVSTSSGQATEIVIPGAPSGVYKYSIYIAPHPTLGTDVLIVTVEVTWFGWTPGSQQKSNRHADHTFRLVGYKSK